ncbi:tumor necrosis factor receptor superfamily member 14-like [Pristis pectinata]|uniref:tumor necrosis factor receptor superfamily member 14-like n=1 Tax=Pristis pectinata TaxID=685728 RepID=UPI00223D62CC|nr:tumor necrosis factor receptor superfamily member 14-like [Pristis pectinata]XP_051895094.1 tumor necrosis factor receptor superfamily member 14-like [Pristis pectinata]XP_051895095.1 tumor necrosis factor receptor superfamily member 14-like [Pristis pectinata]
MCPFPMETEKWKPLPVILKISLLTALLIIGWTSVDREHVFPFSANLKNHVWDRRLHGLESIDNLIMLKRRNRDQQTIQISAGVEKLEVVAPTPHVLLLIILIVTYIIRQENCEAWSLSGTRDDKFKKIFFLLLLVFQLPMITACDPGEYDYNGVCCSLCSAGSFVSRHCTVLTGTTCNPCTAGEYIEHPNGLEKCFKCKTCDQELGLQIKQECTYVRNTICEPREGYYCIDNCQLARKHTTCPPGQGVKEKGTHLKDTVCGECPDGTFSSSDSSTEECKEWTVCEKLNLKQVEPGSTEADVKCGKVHNPAIVASAVSVSLIGIVVIATVTGYFSWKHRHKTREQNGAVNQVGTAEEQSTMI